MSTMGEFRSDCNLYLRDLDNFTNEDCWARKFIVADTYDSALSRRRRAPGATPGYSRTRNLGNRNLNKNTLSNRSCSRRANLAEMDEDNVGPDDNWPSEHTQKNCGCRPYGNLSFCACVGGCLNSSDVRFQEIEYSDTDIGAEGYIMGHGAADYFKDLYSDVDSDVYKECANTNSPL